VQLDSLIFEHISGGDGSNPGYTLTTNNNFEFTFNPMAAAEDGLVFKMKFHLRSATYAHLNLENQVV